MALLVSSARTDIYDAEPALQVQGVVTLEGFQGKAACQQLLWSISQLEKATMLQEDDQR